MISILQKILNKRGIKDLRELDKDERATFENWETQLMESEITADKMKDFCLGEIGKIEDKLTPDNSNEKNNKLIALLTCYKAVARLINSKISERENLIKHLKQLGE